MKKYIGIGSFVLLLAFWIAPWGLLTHAQATPHSITISWTASTSVITGYKPYRGTVTGGPYTNIGTTAANATSFVDSTGAAGQKYFYVVTAVNGTNESIFSNETSATMIGNPLPPQGVTAIAQ